MDTKGTSCAFLRTLIIVIVCNVLFVLSTPEHSHHEHSASHTSTTTVLAKDTTNNPMDEELASKVEYESEVRVTDSDVRDSIHDHHSAHEHKEIANHEMHHQHQSSNPEMHHHQSSNPEMHHQHQSSNPEMHHHQSSNPEMHHQHQSPDREMLLDEAAAPRGSDLTKVDSHHEGHSANHKDHTNPEKHDMEDHSKHDMDHDTHMDADMHMDHDMHMDNHSGMHMMVFHAGIDEVVLFKEWKISTIGGMIGSMIGIMLLGIFYEGLKYFREHLFKQYVASMQFSTVAVTGESGRVTQVHKIERHRILSSSHGLQTCLHVVQIVMSYFLMLIFMTYNVWLCIAVIVGSAIGYFTFGWKKATVVDITEHCH